VELGKLYESLKLMTELNQKSMQTPHEEEKKRSSQVDEIKARVIDLEKKSDAKKKLLDEITHELKEEKEKANNQISKILGEYSEIENDNDAELKKLKTNFNTEKTFLETEYEKEKKQRIENKTKREKDIQASKGKIFKGETQTIKDWLDNLTNQQSAIKKYDEEMRSR